MTMPFIIHIGPPKTGTTTIQDSLEIASNDNTLSRQNATYVNNYICNNDGTRHRYV